MRGLRPRRRPTIQLPLTALIDVVFLLLIYFLLTSSFVNRQGLRIELPGSRLAQRETSPLIVYVDREGHILFEGRKVSPEELTALLRLRLRQSAERTVVLAADRLTPLQTIVSVMESVRLAGARNLTLATRKVSKGTPSSRK